MFFCSTGLFAYTFVVCWLQHNSCYFTGGIKHNLDFYCNDHVYKQQSNDNNSQYYYNNLAGFTFYVNFYKYNNKQFNINNYYNCPALLGKIIWRQWW